MAIEDQNPNPVGENESSGTIDGAAAVRERLKKAVVVGALVLIILACAIFILFRSQTRLPKPEPLPDVVKLATSDLPLGRGTALVLVLAFDCDHCKQVGSLVSTFDPQELGVDISVVGYGTEEEAKAFFAETALFVPYRLATNQEYLEYSGEDSTTVYLLRDGKTLAAWLGYAFSLADLENALRSDL